MLLGSSGVGKSTIINNLVGNDSIKVQEVKRSDSKGKTYNKLSVKCIFFQVKR